MKKMLVKSALAALVGVGLTAGGVLATPITYGDGGVALQGVLDGITVGGPSSVDVTSDNLSDDGDSYWRVTGTGGSVSTFIIELAGFAGTNTFGVYDANDSSKMVELFSGSSTGGSQALLSIKADGSVFVNFTDTGVDFSAFAFGYYLDSTAETDPNLQGGVFYSDTSLNQDGIDHMAAFAGTNTDTVQLPGFAPGLWTNNEYVLAWEDVYGGYDKDYTDMVLMVESVNPIPEPATMLLFGTGLAGLAGVSRRRKK